MKNYVITYHENRDHREFVWETQAGSEGEAATNFKRENIGLIISIEEGIWDRENFKIMK